MSKLIGLTGKKGSGKDELAKPLIQSGYRNFKMAFALKHICSQVTKLPYEVFEDPKFKDSNFGNKPIELTFFQIVDLAEKLCKEGEFKIKDDFEFLSICKQPFKTPRQLLQIVGTDLARNLIDEDYWTKIAESNIKTMLKQAPVIVTDIRFPNEAALIKRLGGEIVKIERETAQKDGHISDNMDISACKVIDNNGTIEILHKKALDLLKE